jgi:hypothetical protein
MILAEENPFKMEVQQYNDLTVQQRKKGKIL